MIPTKGDEVEVGTTVRLQRCLERLNLGDEHAREEMLQFAQRRLHILAGRMHARFECLQGIEEPSDILQPALLRLWRALAEKTPESVLHFMRLAALQIRRELCDLARQNYGRHNAENKIGSHSLNLNSIGPVNSPLQRDEANESPLKLAQWTEFHEAVEALPDDERQAFELLWYHELPQVEAAELMGITDRQLRRYWVSARIRLRSMLPADTEDSQ